MNSIIKSFWRRIRHLTPLFLTLMALPSARCQLLVQSSNSIGLYNFNGTVINSNFLPVGLSSPQGIVASGSNIFVVNFTPSTVGKYNIDGTLINPKIITNLIGPESLLVLGTNLYVASFKGVGIYDLNGAAINASLISFHADGMATDGANFYLTSIGASPETVGKFRLDGTPVNTNFISGFNTPAGIAVDQSNVYVADFQNGTIGKYDLSSGATVNASLVSGLYHPNGLAIIGGLIYVECATNVGVYGLDGTTKNASLVSISLWMFDNFGIASMPPIALQNAAIRSNTFSFIVNGFSNQVVVVEASQTLGAPNWMPLQTNTLSAGTNFISDPAWTNYPGRFYRLQPQ